MKAKALLAFVQKVVRHSDPAITSNVYGNIGLDDLRDALNVMGDEVSGQSLDCSLTKRRRSSASSVASPSESSAGSLNSFLTFR